MWMHGWLLVQRGAREVAGCAFTRSCPAAAHGNADTVMVAVDGRANGYTLAAGARSAQRDTRRSKAERRSGVSGRK